MRRPVAIGLTALLALAGLVLLLPQSLPVSPQAAALAAPWNAPLQLHASRAAFAQGEEALAGEFGVRALHAMPMDQPALALARLSGRAKDPARALNLSAALGWRDPIANAQLIAAAIEQGAPIIAAQRVDAFGRVKGGEAAATAADQVMSMEGGAEALAARAENRVGSLWWISYLRMAPAADAAAQGRLRFARSIDPDDGPWKRLLIATLAGNSASRLPPSAIERLWRTTLADPEGFGSILYDENLSRWHAGELSVGREWRVMQASPIGVVREQTGGIALARRSDSSGLVLLQPVSLPKGRLTLVAEGSDNAGGAVWRIFCAGRGQMYETRAPVGTWVVSMGATCPDATLELHALEGGPAAADFAISRVALEPAG